MKQFGRYTINEQGEVTSGSGRTYALLEGIAFPFGGYTSDIVFIMECDDERGYIGLIAYLFGANGSSIEYDVCDIIDRYEKTGEKLV